MDSKERENFNRNSTLIVENTKEGFDDLIELNVSLGGYSSFENFINDKQHDIYHLCYNRSRCCQCSPRYVLPKTRILHPSQLELLLDKTGSKKICHNPGRTADFCCCVAHNGLTTSVLDVTLARCLLVNFCQDVFWYSCLTAQKTTLEDFLTHNKHHFYHLYDINNRCCQCPPTSYVFPTQRQLITKTQWNQLFSTPCLPCQLDRKRPVGGPQTICASSVTPGISVSSLSPDLSQLLIDHCCPLKQSIEQLVEIRNSTFGHAKEARIPEHEYVKYRYQIESNLVFIGQICNKQGIVKQKLKDLDRRTLDSVLLMQTIREQLNTMKEMSTLISEECADIRNEVKEEGSNIREHMDAKINDMSAKLSHIGQDTVRQQIQEKRQQLLENTKDSIQTHTNENTFVHTNVVNEALSCVKQNGRVILKGPPGIGKSRIGLELLRKISLEDITCQPIQLKDISQCQDMCKDMDVVLIDDVFGRTNCSYNDDVHFKQLETIFTTTQNRNVKVILTLRSNIFQTVAINTESLRMFQDQYVIDLSKHQMTVEERKSCFMNYFAKNKIEVTDHINKENIHDDFILDTDTTVYLHTGTLKKIVYSDIGTHIGFPEACYLFASHRKFTKQGSNFFCHPTKHLSKEIHNLRMKGDTNNRRMIDFTLLVYILLNDDSINIDDIDQEAFRNIMETIYLNPLNNIPPSYINDSANRLSGTYLRINNYGNYCFQHRLISEAVMISYSSTDPNRVIPLLGFDFITEMARPRNYRPREEEVIFTIPKSCYSLLAQRLLQLISTDYKEVPYRFVQNLCKSKIITMTGDSILQEMITQFDLELICDHRFSGKPHGYIITTNFLYLPVALLLFYNIDNDTFYKYLYNRIHNTLTSESDNDVMDASKETVTSESDSVVIETSKETLTSESDSDITEICKVALFEALNFAVCALDKKRSTVILKILTDHNIKQNDTSFELQNDTSFEFCYKIVLLQGLSGVQLLLGLHGLSHVFNINLMLSKIFLSFFFHEITIDDNMKQFITSVIVNYNHDKLLVRDIVEFVCKKGQLDFVKYVCERFDRSLLDVEEMINADCSGSKTEVLLWLFEKYDGLYNVQKALDDACQRGSIESVKVILDRSGHTLLDMELTMNKACSSGNTEFVEWLCKNVDNNLFDMKTAMNMACSSGNTELVEWLCDNVDNNLFDIKTAMNKACSRGNSELVKWLYEKFGNNLIDMKSAIM